MNSKNKSNRRDSTMENNKTRLAGLISMITLILTILWLILLIFGLIRHGSVTSLEETISLMEKMDFLYYITYLNAAFITVFVTALFACFYVEFRKSEQQWAMIAVLFVPSYTMLNLFVYLSQITIVPGLISNNPDTTILLAQMLQQLPGSTVYIINNLAYAVLGIPSIIFGIFLLRRTLSGGILLAMNGFACIVGFAGIATDHKILSLGSVIGGIFFLLALIPISIEFLKRNEDEKADSDRIRIKGKERKAHVR